MKKFLFFLTFIIFFNLIKPAQAYAAASLSLSPATATKNVGDAFNVDIVLNTGGDAAAGVTAILTYDTTKLQVTSGSQITAGSLFTNPLTNTVNSTIGEIRFDSGSLGTAYTGTGTVATIPFKALAAGNAAVNFTFNPSSTTNTSLVASAASPTNLLTTVNNGTYTISSGTTTTTTPPVTGVVENTLMVIGGGIFLILTGWFLARGRII